MQRKKRYFAVVAWFNDAKGFGYAKCDGQEEPVFLHYSSIKQSKTKRRTIMPGQRVVLELDDRKPWDRDLRATSITAKKG